MKNVLEYKNYIGTVNYSSEDATFYGKIEGINDLVLFEGESVNELKKGFEGAVIDYLETCKEIDKEPNKIYKGVFNVRISKSIHKEIALIAIKNGLKLNDLVNKTLHYLVDNEGKVLK
jgi:predicted HicB family RNase H-like nuclease